MKIAKQALLFGAFAMLFSTVPMQAMETVEEDVMVAQDVPADVQAEVAIKRGFFAGWDKDATNERLKNAMEELDKLWKKFMKCIKGDKGCPRSLVWAIRGTILTILALVMKGRIQRGAEWISRQVVPSEPKIRVETFEPGIRPTPLPRAQTSLPEPNSPGKPPALEMSK